MTLEGKAQGGALKVGTAVPGAGEGAMGGADGAGGAGGVTPTRRGHGRRLGTKGRVIVISDC